MRTIILVIFAICISGTWTGCEKEEIMLEEQCQCKFKTQNSDNVTVFDTPCIDTIGLSFADFTVNGTGGSVGVSVVINQVAIDSYATEVCSPILQSADNPVYSNN